MKAYNKAKFGNFAYHNIVFHVKEAPLDAIFFCLWMPKIRCSSAHLRGIFVGSDENIYAVVIEVLSPFSHGICIYFSLFCHYTPLSSLSIGE